MRIQTRMMLFVTVLMLAVISSTLASVVVDKRQMIRRNFDLRINTMLDGVQRIAEESLRSHDDVMLLSYLKHLIKDSQEIELAVVTKPGYSSVLGEVRTPLFYRTLNVVAEDSGAKPAQVQIEVGLSKAALDRRLREEMAKTLVRVGGLGLLGLLLGLGGAWWISSTLAGPIVSLAARLRAFAFGEAQAPVTAAGDEVSYLSSQFDTMSGRIQEHMQLRDDLLTTLTHELNNPLAGLKGLLGLLSANRLVDRETSETYKTMTDAVSAMELSLSNALTLLRGNAKPELRREPILLNDLVDQIARLFRPVAQSNHVRFREELCPRPVRIEGDVELVRRIVINLVSNACKYTPPGGTVTLKLSDEGGALISVADTGPGIAAKDRELIFTRFYRAPGPDGKPQRIPGSGLGLAIARQAAELHQAKIWVDSEPGKGSSFSVLFPQRQVPQAPEAGV